MHRKHINKKHTQNTNCLLTLFPKRFLWRAKHLRKDWPSIVYLNVLFCSPCRPIVVHDDGSRVYVQCEDREVYLIAKIRLDFLFIR